MNFKLWIAQGLGLGRIPFAPGTAGSVLGLLWFFLLLSAGNWWVFITGNVLAVASLDERRNLAVA